MLTIQEGILLGIIAVTLVVMMLELLRADLMAILVLAALPLTGIVTVQEAFSGFSRSVVITIIGLFIITQALEDTGIVQWIADRLRHMGAGSEVRLIVLFMSAGAALSLLMNNIAAGAVLLPAAVQVSRESQLPPSKLLMPLAFGTLVGGMATYFTTANIILSSILRDQQQPPLGMMDFLPTGGIIVVAGLLFMVLLGRRLLPSRESVGQTASAYLLSRDLTEMYQLHEQLWEVRVLPDSQLVGLTLDQSKIGQTLGLTVVAIWRGHQAILNPRPDEVIQAEDYLVVLGWKERAASLAAWGAVVGRPQDRRDDEQNYFVDLAEVVIPPRSSVLGKSLAEMNFRNKYHLTGVALWREGLSFRHDVGTIPLEPGDALLMVGTPERIKELANERDFLVLQGTHTARPPLPQKAGWALAITGLVLLASIVEAIPTAEAMMMGVAGLALSGCINLDDAYRGISWRVIFLIAGMLPLSIAMVNTGLATRVGNALVTLTAPYGPLALVTALFLLTVLATQIIGGQVAALIVGPIAVTAALQLGVNAQAVAVAVAIACSAAFLTPIAHPVNILMMGPGSYTPRDFVRVGAGMTVVTLAALLLGMRVLWRL
ncbi:MAG TPA: SLC13 family permease [Caldilineaceae bacterium]|nr:SLC13 family permease [Caldilineaceae bacterium]